MSSLGTLSRLPLEIRDQIFHEVFDHEDLSKSILLHPILKTSKQIRKGALEAFVRDIAFVDDRTQGDNLRTFIRTINKTIEVHKHCRSLCVSKKPVYLSTNPHFTTWKAHYDLPLTNHESITNTLKEMRQEHGIPSERLYVDTSYVFWLRRPVFFAEQGFIAIASWKLCIPIKVKMGDREGALRDLDTVCESIRSGVLGTLLPHALSKETSPTLRSHSTHGMNVLRVSMWQAQVVAGQLRDYHTRLIDYMMKEWEEE